MDEAELVERLRRHVVVLADVIGERHTDRPAALQQTREYLTEQLVALGDQPVADIFRTSQRHAVNFEVIRPGDDDQLPAIVLGAHYDTVPGTPGADDNASAVAVLLEVLRALRNVSHRRTLRALMYDCEEAPHFNLGEMGSQRHAAKLREQDVQLLGMICLESVGYFDSSAPASDYLPLPLRLLQRWYVGGHSIVAVANPSSARFLARMLPGLLSRHGVAIRPIVFPPRVLPAIQFSDHRGYWEQGYPAVMLTDTAFLRNPHYHEPIDRVDTLDFARMALFCRQLTRCVRRLIR